MVERGGGRATQWAQIDEDYNLLAAENGVWLSHDCTMRQVA